MPMGGGGDGTVEREQERRQQPTADYCNNNYNSNDE